MNEHKVRQRVHELMKTLGCNEKQSENASCDVYVEALLKKNVQHSTIKAMSMSNINKLAEASQQPARFMQMYEDMKLKHTEGLDSAVCLLSKIQNSSEVKSFLKRESVNKSNGSISQHSEKSSFNDKSNLSNGNISYKENHVYRKQILVNSLISSNKSTTEERKVPPGIYPLSKSLNDRIYLSWDFVEDPSSDFIVSGPIGVLPPNVQESRLIDDILFCLVGIEGDYIHCKKLSNLDNNKKSFHIDDSANVALKLLVQNMLPMFSHYSTIIQFVEENLHYEKGLVNHALSAAIRTFLKDYFILVSQLEGQHLQHSLTLQKLWFYLQPSLTTMEIIADIASTLKEKKYFGGAVLSFLHESTSSLTGSSKAQEICHSLTRAAALPYFEILEKWIYKGIISDCYSEFLVEDNELIKKKDLPQEYSDAYWEKRYTIRCDQIPTFLVKATDMILRTGKYINVIRQCGKTVNCPDAKAIVYTMRESQYIECLEPAYHFASKKLLDHLMDDTDLKKRLLSVKHYFLLDQGDFIIQFMDMASEELQKDIDDIMPTRLESLLELALRTSVVNEDKYKDDVRVELLPYDLLTQMFKILKIPSEKQTENKSFGIGSLTGLEAFAFDYEVKWPLSLVINRKAITFYQILFRHLFYCKHIENLLGQVWALNKQMKSLPRSEICIYAPAFALRQRMLNFVQNLDYYLTLEVIEPHWNDFFRKISQVTNIDEVLDCHNDFLEKCVDDCMLMDPALLQVLATLMKLCADFSIFLQGFMKCSETEASIMGESLLHSINELPLTSMCPKSLESFQLQISSFEKKFDESIIRMLKILHSVNQSKQTSKIINMLYRLDFSRFYEEMSQKDLENVDHVFCL